jgi:hypothetical protein
MVESKNQYRKLLDRILTLIDERNTIKSIADKKYQSDKNKLLFPLVGKCFRLKSKQDAILESAVDPYSYIQLVGINGMGFDAIEIIWNGESPNFIRDINPIILWLEDFDLFEEIEQSDFSTICKRCIIDAVCRNKLIIFQHKNLKGIMRKLINETHVKFTKAVKLDWST